MSTREDRIPGPRRRRPRSLFDLQSVLEDERPLGLLDVVQQPRGRRALTPVEERAQQRAPGAIMRLLEGMGDTGGVLTMDLPEGRDPNQHYLTRGPGPVRRAMNRAGASIAENPVVRIANALFSGGLADIERGPAAAMAGVFGRGADKVRRVLKNGKTVTLTLDDATRRVTASMDGKNVGTLVLDGEGGALYPGALVVQPNQRRQGVADAMFDLLEERGVELAGAPENFQTDAGRAFLQARTRRAPERFAGQRTSRPARDDISKHDNALPMPRRTVDSVTDEIMHTIEQNPDGFTFDARTGVPYDVAQGGYAVSPSKGTELKGQGRDELRSWVEKNWEELQKEGRYVGGWLDSSTGNFVTDVSRVVGDLEEAKRIGRAGDQDAVFDFANMAEIRLREPSNVTARLSVPEGVELSPQSQQFLDAGAELLRINPNPDIAPASLPTPEIAPMGKAPPLTPAARAYREEQERAVRQASRSLFSVEDGGLNELPPGGAAGDAILAKPEPVTSLLDSQERALREGILSLAELEALRPAMLIDGQIFKGANHGEAAENAMRALGVDDFDALPEFEDGFAIGRQFYSIDEIPGIGSSEDLRAARIRAARRLGGGTLAQPGSMFDAYEGTDIQGTVPSPESLRIPEPRTANTQRSMLVDAILAKPEPVTSLLDSDVERALEQFGETGPKWYELGPLRRFMEDIGLSGENFNTFQDLGAAASARNQVTNEIPLSTIFNYARMRGIPVEEAARLFFAEAGRGIQMMPSHRAAQERALREGILSPADPYTANWKTPSYGAGRAGRGGLEAGAAGGTPALDVMDRRRIMQAVMGDDELREIAEATGAADVARTERGGGMLPLQNAQDYLGISELYSEGAKRFGLPTAHAYQAPRWLGGAEETGLRTPSGRTFLQLMEEVLAGTLQQRGMPNVPTSRADYLAEVLRGNAFLYPPTADQRRRMQTGQSLFE